MNYFILGAPDHEMIEIARVLTSTHQAFSHATVSGKVVKSKTAYLATGIEGVIPAGAELIFVECAVMGLRPTQVIDHHHPGDPGFGMAPKDYLLGSSLGQLLALLGLEPTAEQRIIAAADHCLKHAYDGECPGVDIDQLAQWRVYTRARARNISESELVVQIGAAEKALQAAPRIKLADIDVAWFEQTTPELSEASARIGMPYAYAWAEPDGTLKAGIKSAPAIAVKTWMDTCGLKGVYGDPQRGFAGGYFR